MPQVADRNTAAEGVANGGVAIGVVVMAFLMVIVTAVCCLLVNVMILVRGLEICLVMTEAELRRHLDSLGLLLSVLAHPSPNWLVLRSANNCPPDEGYSFRGARKKSKAQGVATSRFLERSTGRIDESGGQLFAERSTRS